MSDDKVTWLRNRPHLCVSPHVKYEFRIRQKGLSVSCCCNLDTSYSDKSLTTELVDEVSSTMAQRHTHPACWRCHDEEHRGHISERIRGLLGRHEVDLARFDKDGVDHPEVEVGMKFSNLCNLACRSCDSHDSSTFSKISGRPPPDPKMAIDLSDVPEDWDFITKHIKEKYQSRGDKQFILHPIGGETFLQPGVHKLLGWMIENDMAAETQLRITTSFATPLSDFLLDKFQQFKEVMLLNSIDSVGDNYHHVRWPAKFDKVERNLDLLVKLHNTNPQRFRTIGVLPTFSLNNIFYMPEILDFWHEWFEENRVPGLINTTHLYRPVFLSVDILPDQYRGHLLEIFENCLSHEIFRANKRVASLYEYVQATLAILNSPNNASESVFHDYLRFSADYDRRTGSDSFQGNRKFFNLLAPDHVDIYRRHYDSTNITIPIYYNDPDNA